MMIKNLQPRLVELGKIKIGGKGAEKTSQSSGKKFRVPEKWDHVVITTLERDAIGDFKPDAALMKRLLDVTGSTDGKLREVPVALMSDEVEDALQSAHTLYVGHKCVAQCDGETATWYVDPKSREAFDPPRVGKCTGEHERTGWKPHGTFSCQIAAGEARFGGVYKLRTTSIITIERLYSSLQTVKALTGGFLRGAPLRLVLSPVEVSPEGKSSTVYCLHVELRGQDLSEIQRQVISFAQVQRQTTAQLADLRKLLRAPGAADEPADEQADVAEEFAPGEANALPVEDHVAERAREIAAETGGRVSPGGGIVYQDDEPAPLPLPDPPKPRRAAAQTVVQQPAPTAPTSKANGATPPPSAIDADQLPF